MVTFGSELLAAAVAGTEAGEHPLRHVAELPARHGRQQPWPTWVEPDVLRAFTDRGVSSPWAHQVQAANLAHAGRHVVISTGTASGKSLAYQLPILNALATDPARPRAVHLTDESPWPRPTAGRHSLCAAMTRLADVAPTAYDGDTPTEIRRLARERSRWVFSNPDMVHLALLRNHARWAMFLRNLRYVVVDECHYYRGVFGSNVAMVLRRLLRLCARYSADPAAVPTVIFASATTSAPGATATELIGQPVEEVTEDGSPQGARTVALWEPALRTDLTGENGAPVRRSAGSEAARLMADLVAEGARTLTFVRSRRGAELTALATRARLEDIAPQLTETWRPIGRVIFPRTAMRSSKHCSTGGCAVWPPPTRSNSASTSPAWMRWCWPVFPEPSLRSGSKPADPAAAGRARWWCWSPAMTRWIPTWCTTLPPYWTSRSSGW